ncbi:hypothetical protein [Caballeronia sp. Sq4a]|nr:hypothetical protein [Caballeronia sp. Sq4a]
MDLDSKAMKQLRLGFANLASQEGANQRASCRQYRISPKAGYNWIGHYE